MHVRVLPRRADAGSEHLVIGDHVMENSPNSPSIKISKRLNKKSTLPVQPSIHPSASWPVSTILSVTIALLILISLVGWVLHRQRSGKRKRSITQLKRQKSDRECVARFYGSNSRSGFVQVRAKTCQPTTKSALLGGEQQQQLQQQQQQLQQRLTELSKLSNSSARSSLSKSFDSETESNRRASSSMRNPAFKYERHQRQQNSRVQFYLHAQQPGIGKPQTIQPKEVGNSPYGATLDSDTARNLLSGRMHTRATSLTGSCQASHSSLQSIDSLRRHSSAYGHVEHLWSAAAATNTLRSASSTSSTLSRKCSIRPDRFSVAEMTGRQIKCTPVGQIRRSLRETDDSWVNYELSLYGRGRISFSLSYVCTVGMLTVTVNRLAGVHRLREASESLLPSQSQTTFMVGLRLRDTALGAVTTQSHGFTSSHCTHSVLSSLNPIFDQSFSFQLRSQDIEVAELVFTIRKATFEPVAYPELSALPQIEPRRFSTISCPTDGGSKRGSLDFRLPDETKCLGMARYKLEREDLINHPESVREIWRDIERVADFDDPPADECGMSIPLLGSSVDFVSEEVTNSETTESIQTAIFDTRSAAIQISLRYNKQTSHLLICLKDARNLSLRKSDICIFTRTALYKGDQMLASSRSPTIVIRDAMRLRFSPLARSSSVNAGSDESKGNVVWGKASCGRGRSLRRRVRQPSEPDVKSSRSDTPVVFPRDELIQFPICQARVLEGTTMGFIVYVCTRSRFGLSHLIGRCVIGASGFTDGHGVQMWSQLIGAVRELTDGCDTNATTTSGTNCITNDISQWIALT